MYRNLKQFQVNVICYMGDASSALPQRNLEELESYGVETTLSEIFDAPLAVKRVIDDNHGITSTFVGTDKAGKMIENILKETEVVLIWSDQTV